MQANTMVIEIIDVTSETAVDKRGRDYLKLKVVFQNRTFGKVDSSTIMPFNSVEVHDRLKTATKGQVFTVTREKNGDYWNWIEIVEGDKKVTETGESNMADAKPVARSNYETPDERAARQVMIVRQSSLSNAIATLAVGAKGVDPAQVLEVAQTYVNFVLQEDV